MLMPRLIYGLIVAACVLRHSAADEDEEVCAAGDSSPSCRQGAGAVAAEGADDGAFGATRSISPTVVAPGPQADLITQEVQELQNVIELSKERIRLLLELQEALKSDHKLPFPDSHAKALREEVPLLSQVAADVERAPAAAAEDYLISKAVIASGEEFKFVRFMPLRSPRSSTSSSSSTQTPMPTALLVAARADGAVRLFTPSGELVLSFSAGHDQPVTHIAASPSHEEYLLATSDAGGVIRTHKVSMRQRRLSKNEKQDRRKSLDEKVSQHLGSSVNVTVQLHRQMEMPLDEDGDMRPITALALASQGGSKYLLAGDAAGKISVFTRNGTVRARIDTSAMPGVGVDSLFSSPGSVLFRSGAEWGYVDLEKLDVKHVECPAFEGQVTGAILDSQISSRVLAVDEAGTVWAFNVKNKKECKVDLRFAKGTTKGTVELASVRGFAIGLEHAQSPGQFVSLVALNMSQVGKGKNAGSKSNDALPAPPANAVVWRRQRPPVRAWASHRRAKEGDLLAFLSEDGREIEIMELIMHVYTAPAQDSFGNFKMPVIAVAIVLVLGYQYMKQKGKGSGGGGGGLGGKGKFDLGGEDFGSMLRNRKKLSGLKKK